MADLNTNDEVVILVTPRLGEAREVHISAEDWAQWEADVARGYRTTDVEQRLRDAVGNMGIASMRVLRGITQYRPRRKIA